MAKKAYNGFSVDDRHVSARLFKLDMRNGVFPDPKKSACEACLIDMGQLESHREDYSLAGAEGLLTLCYRCHRVLHMRDNNPGAWDAYRGAVRRGFQWAATRDFSRVIAENIKGRVLPSKHPLNVARERTILDDIHDGLLLADPPEIRAERLAALYDRYRSLESAGKIKPLETLLELPLGT